MPKKHKHLTITSRQKKYAARLRDADKPKLSARIAEQIKEFKSKGGKITQFDEFQKEQTPSEDGSES